MSILKHFEVLEKLHVINIITSGAKLLNANWLRYMALFLNHEGSW